MDREEKRANFRVPVPEQMLLALAVWFRDKPAPSRLHVLDLGEPDLALDGANSCGLKVRDLSAHGMRLSWRSGVPSCEGSPEDGLVYVFLRLADPAERSADHVLTLFFGAEAVASRQDGDETVLCMHILHRGVPDKSDKALQFFDVSRFGIKELTRWCDELARSGKARPAPEVPGLILERLPEEIRQALRNRASANPNPIQD